jgi:hypothetical protein
MPAVQVRQLQPQAVASWWQPGHPGWAIYPVDSDQFMSTGALDSLNVQNEQPSHTPSPGANPSLPAHRSDPSALHCPQRDRRLQHCHGRAAAATYATSAAYLLREIAIGGYYMPLYNATASPLLC